MEEKRGPAGRTSSIPRPGGIPRPTSRLPTPTRSTAVPSPQSRENLHVDGGGEIRSSRLRPATPRERLAAGTASGTSNITNIPPPTTIAKLATSTSTPTSTSTQTIPRPRPTPSNPTINNRPKLPKAVNNGLPRQTRESPRDTQISKLPGLRKKASAQWTPASQSTLVTQRRTSITNTSNGDTSSDSRSQASPINEDGAGDETMRTRTLTPRPSLAERTMDTLSRLPSSPALRGRVSNANFFDPETFRPTSRPASSRGSRPSSSRRSESSNPSSARPSLSRPGSSSGPGQDVLFSNPFQSQLATIDSTPVRGRTLGRLETPSTTGLNGSLRSKIPSPCSVRLPRSRTPSPDKSSYARTPINGSKTVAARPVQPRPSLNGLFKKPAVPPTKKKTTASVGTPRRVSAVSQKSARTVSADDAFSAASSTSTMPNAASGDSPPQFKKASSALREQIAKAKAAKRAAAQQVSAQDQETQPAGLGGVSSVIPIDDTFDFGLSDDPFNLNRDANPAARVIKMRVASARTSGRLNIAAMGLKEIPQEVLSMYNLESIGKQDGSWAESVDLTRFVAADNELEMLDESLFPDVDPEEFAEDEDSQGNMFGGLETLDLHGNMLIALPAGLRRLTLLTSLNLSSNRLPNNCLEIISQIVPLRDLKLGSNLLRDTLEPCLGSLINLEILDLHGNNLQRLPPSFGDLHRLRILNLSENSLESVPFDLLSKLPLTELVARKNKLTGVLVQDGVEVLPSLQNLDVSSNQLTALARPNGILALPALTQLCVSMNRLQALPDVSSWFELVTLTADENSINSFPDGFTSLQKLKTVDFSSNDIRVVPAEIARMDSLTMLRLSGNPLRDKKFVSAPTEVLKDALAARLTTLTAVSDGHEGGGGGPIAEALTSNDASLGDNTFENQRSSTSQTVVGREEQEDEDKTDTDDFATPPTSAPPSPTRKRSGTSSGLAWPVKAGGVLDRSNTQSSSLHPVACSKLANEHTIREVQLHHNLFASLPDSLTFFAGSLMSLSLAHNQLVGETYLGGVEDLDLPSLKELNLSSNHITALTPLVNHLHAPNLQKLDVSINRLSSLPSSTDKEKGGKVLRDAFPNLTVLLIANNHLAELDPESIRGMKVVDAANNDIAHLNPRIGLLGGAGGLERLEVTGNRFRVPRWNVLERGTDATLRWLRGRVPVAEMAAWKAEKGCGSEEDVSDVD